MGKNVFNLGPNGSKLSPNWNYWVKIGKIGSEHVQIGKIGISSNWGQIGFKFGPNGSKLVQEGRNGVKIGLGGSIWVEKFHLGRNRTKNTNQAKIGSKIGPK